MAETQELNPKEIPIMQEFLGVLISVIFAWVM